MCKVLCRVVKLGGVMTTVCIGGVCSLETALYLNGCLGDRVPWVCVNVSADIRYKIGEISIGGIQ